MPKIEGIFKITFNIQKNNIWKYFHKLAFAKTIFFQKKHYLADGCQPIPYSYGIYTFPYLINQIGTCLCSQI